MPVFFKPSDGWACDFVPFFWEGQYHLFYLKDYRDKDTYGEGTPWFHLNSPDLVTLSDLGEALQRGRSDEQDLYVFTGCVIEAAGQFHIFYTGHNPHLRKQGKPEQAIMHATSHDLVKWNKNSATPLLFADPERYEMHDWRDPFVFWNEEEQEYWMLLAARLKNGPSHRRGCTALATSNDLLNWEICDPLWAPGLYYTHECPDLFRIGDWWYLVFSTFSDRYLTHYRMSRDPRGPWITPSNDSFDGRAFYAAKTAGDGVRRFAFGWNPTRTGETDTGEWNWGGQLVVHEVNQEADGSLSVMPPHEVTSQFHTPVELSPCFEMGKWVAKGNSLIGYAESSFAWSRLTEMPFTGKLDVEITFTANTRDCGIFLRADENLEKYYQIRLEPSRSRVTFERWPQSPAEPPIVERPVDMGPDIPIHVQLISEGSVIVVYVDKVAMSTRGYDHRNGSYGLFVSEGTATFSNIKVCKTDP